MRDASALGIEPGWVRPGGARWLQPLRVVQLLLVAPFQVFFVRFFQLQKREAVFWCVEVCDLMCSDDLMIIEQFGLSHHEHVTLRFFVTTKATQQKKNKLKRKSALCLSLNGRTKHYFSTISDDITTSLSEYDKN